MLFFCYSFLVFVITYLVIIFFLVVFCILFIRQFCLCQFLVLTAFSEGTWAPKSLIGTYLLMIELNLKKCLNWIKTLRFRDF